MISFLRHPFPFDNWPMVLFQRAFCRRTQLLAFHHGRIEEFVVNYSGGDRCGILPCLTSNMYSRYFGFFQKRRPLKVLDLGANAERVCLAVIVAAGFRMEKLVCVEIDPPDLCSTAIQHKPKFWLRSNRSARGRGRSERHGPRSRQPGRDQ